jgi:hypothetical protein
MFERSSTLRVVGQFLATAVSANPTISPTFGTQPLNGGPKPLSGPMVRVP